MEKMNLLGKTQKDVDEYVAKLEEEKIKEFHEKYKEVTYDTIYKFLEDNKVDKSNAQLFAPVTRMELSDAPEDVTMGQAKKMVAQNNEAAKLYNHVKYYDLMKKLCLLSWTNMYVYHFPK